MALLEIKELKKSFTIHSLGTHIEACKDVSLTLEEGEFVGITGRSGSGKSTILRCIYRTYLADGGVILYDSEAFGKIDLIKASEQEILQLRKRELGYVSQFFQAPPRTTALEIMIQAITETNETEDPKSLAIAFLEHFELEKSLWDSYPKTFSGGEKLRLNVARAMVKKPRLLLLDEPTASLDEASKNKVRELIVKLKNDGTTMLGIFHDIEFMEGISDRVLNMQKGVLR
ncbi:phosphonate C-P lyase system protein PhnL [Guggenheimella bovis]